MITREDLSNLTNDELLDLQQMLNVECDKPWRTVKSLSLDNVLRYKGKEIGSSEVAPSLIQDAAVLHE